MKCVYLLAFVLLGLSWQAADAQIYDDFLGAGHDQGITVTTSNNSGGDVGENTINGFGLIATDVETSRFLAHTTFGANIEMIEAVTAQGYEAWLEEQFTMPPSYTMDVFDEVLATFPVEEFFEELPHFLGSWWHTALTADDQLRHRVALALSEVFVVSYRSDLGNTAPALASYYDMLVDNSFGNFRDLMFDVTMHPVMGYYLSHLNNPRSIPMLNIHPDENYAREIMQLFSIGLHELNMDGTPKLDDEGNLIPTYDNADIRELAKVFTGLGCSELNELGVQVGYPGPDFGVNFFAIDATVPMTMYDEWHEPGNKIILKDHIIPGGQTGMEDINEALDVLFEHPNVGPFISIRLIQRLIKSNPTPDYVARVVSVFNDNGEGVRGDMQAVIRAIVMDPEARNCSFIENEENGRLKEPIIRYTQMLRAFDVFNDIGLLIDPGYVPDFFLLQNIFGAPSVFNFFEPDYSPNGPINEAGLVAPEFQILNSTSAINYVNIVEYWTISQQPMTIYSFGEEGNVITSEFDFTEELTFAADTEALLDRMDLVLCHGQMSENTRGVITQTLSAFSGGPEQNQVRVLVALYLTMISPDFVVMR